MKAVRCAIYTRKSSEEGLDQSFNSLHAQREACEAYVSSQKHEGWQALSAKYDDGGFSGGNMDRPGLKKLLADIESGKVDTVVVYKVDRLTRSLADFAKIVETFDAKGVSFVSVTQQFNTTTSMGRLTLNVLLSFAQFEREVTGERIRDKVAASKRKGMWMGGNVPLGYDLHDRRLIINLQEAEQVRAIFEHYIRLRSVFELYDYLKANGFRSKQRVSSIGRKIGGAVLSRGTLYHLLSNPLYIGKIAHKGKLHDGLHEAIVSPEMWQKTVETLAGNRVKRKTSHNVSSGRILLGLLFDEAGNRFTPTHSSKKSRRYAYYTLKTNDKPATRLPALELEQLIASKIRELLSKSLDLAAHYPGLAVKDTRLLVTAGQHLAEQLVEITPADSVNLLRKFLVRVVVVPEDLLEIEINRSELKAVLLGNVSGSCENEPIKLVAPLLIKRRGSEVRLVLENGASLEPKPVSSLIKAIAWSRYWADQIVTGKMITLEDLAKSAGVSRFYARRMLQCAALSPALIETVLEGRQPVELSFDKLTRNLPLEWDKQSLAG